MLHSKICVLCGRKNEFFDESLRVAPQVENTVNRILSNLDSGIPVYLTELASV
jgi:hypothetical protein